MDTAAPMRSTDAFAPSVSAFRARSLGRNAGEGAGLRAPLQSPRLHPPPHLPHRPDITQLGPALYNHSLEAITAIMGVITAIMGVIKAAITATTWGDHGYDFELFGGDHGYYLG